MTLTLPYLIILLLPGFFSLWVYQGFADAQMLRESDLANAVCGMAFGLTSLFLYRCAGDPFLLTDWAALAGGTEIFDGAFFRAYFRLVCLALFTGLGAGILNTALGTPAGWLRRAGAKLLKRGCRQNIDSVLLHEIGRLTLEYPRLLVGIGRQDGGPYDALGFFQSISETREILLSSSNLFRDLAGEQKKFVQSLPSLCVVTETGRVVTLMPLSEEEYRWLGESLSQRRETIIASS